jgi:hypothetical protein
MKTVTGVVCGLLADSKAAKTRSIVCLSGAVTSKVKPASF